MRIIIIKTSLGNCDTFMVIKTILNIFPLMKISKWCFLININFILNIFPLYKFKNFRFSLTDIKILSYR